MLPYKLRVLVLHTQISSHTSTAHAVAAAGAADAPRCRNTSLLLLYAAVPLSPPHCLVLL